jgi:tetratricopeptide (TPR) repeat protein
MIFDSSKTLDGGFEMRLRYAFGLLGLAFVLANAPAPAAAQGASGASTEEQARAHFRLGRAHYDNGSFAQAGMEFEEAYRISQRPALLYNIYLAYRDANDTRKAADALRKYLQLEKEIENRGQLESKLAALDRAIASEPPPPAATQAPAKPALAAAPAPSAAQPKPPAPLQPSNAAPETAAPPAPEPMPAPEAATRESAPRGSAFPLVPAILMGTGGAMMATSVVTGIMAASKSSKWADALDACERAHNCASLPSTKLAELKDVKSSGQTLATVTDILLFGGMAVAGTGVVLWLIDLGTSGESETASEPAAGLTCAPGGCQASLRASF